MKNRRYTKCMVDPSAKDADFAGQHRNQAVAEGQAADRTIAMRHLRAAIAAGLASGRGRSAAVVFQRLEAKYRGLARAVRIESPR